MKHDDGHQNEEANLHKALLISRPRALELIAWLAKELNEEQKKQEIELASGLSDLMGEIASLKVADNNGALTLEADSELAKAQAVARRAEARAKNAVAAFQRLKRKVAKLEGKPFEPDDEL